MAQILSSTDMDETNIENLTRSVKSREQIFRDVKSFFTAHICAPSTDIHSDSSLAEDLQLSEKDEAAIRRYLEDENEVDLTDMELNRSENDWLPPAPWDLEKPESKYKSRHANIDDVVNAIALKKWEPAPLIERPFVERAAQYAASYTLFGLLLSLPLYGIYLTLLG